MKQGRRLDRYDACQYSTWRGGDGDRVARPALRVRGSQSIRRRGSGPKFGHAAMVEIDNSALAVRLTVAAESSGFPALTKSLRGTS